MQGKDFLYFLQNELSQFYYIDGLGNLQVASNPVPLTFTPDGWQELSILTEKNKAYFALDRTYGAPQSFVEDGAAILKKNFYGKGMEQTTYLLVLEQQLYLSDTEYGYYYTQLIKCEIDLSTFDHQGPTVSASILEGDITRAIKANESTAYEFDIDVDQAKSLLLDGLNLRETVNAIVNQTGPGNTNFRNVVMELQITTTEEKSRLGTQDTTDSTTGGYLDNAAVFASKRNFLKTTVATDVPTYWDYQLVTNDPNTGHSAFLVWRVYDALGNLINDPSYLLQTVVLNPSGSHSYQFTGNKTVSIPANCTAYLVTVFSTSLDFNSTITLAYAYQFNNITSTGNPGDPNLTVSYFYRFAASIIKVLPANYLFSQIVSQLTNGKYTGKSTLLDNLDPYVVFTSGDGARGLAGAKLKTSLSDFFGFINMRYGVGMGIINGQLVIEKKSFWTNLSDPDVIDIGQAAKLKVTVNTDYPFASLKIGYPNQTYDTALGDINGRYEFNMTQVYITPVTRVKTQMDLTTKYRADMYGIEYTRINLDGKTTSDSSSDNDVFAIHITPSEGVCHLDRTINSYAVGLIDSTSAFNLKLSPKWCFYANGDYFHSCLDKLETKSIVFSTADKDVALAVTFPDGTVIEERANVPINKLPAQLFKPYNLDITIPDRVNLWSLSQRKKLRFTMPYSFGNISFSGFTLKTASQPAINAAQNYTLLCSADTDLTPLIDVYE